MVANKILSFDECEPVFAQLKAGGKTIVHCHGAFDLLHFGHLKHLEEARSLGDVLVVTITSAPYMNKGPGRPVFSDEQRAYHLAHLAIVDHVVVVPKTGAVEIIERVKPDVYCKGIEYATPANETDRRVHEDAAAVERHGGRVAFVGAPLHSSTRLLATHMPVLDQEVREYLESFQGSEVSQAIDDLVARIGALRVLVVGDLIVDRYTYCKMQGLTTKAKIPSLRPEVTKDSLGGSLAIARHVASFGCDTKLLALAGDEPWLQELLEVAEQELTLKLLGGGEGYQTIVKERFVERPGQRKDLIKYFAVNRLLDKPPAELQEKLLASLREELARCDLVILCDYGHGMIDARVQALLEEESPYLALNCQTNSYNYGFNLITKYRHCDLFSLDERELCLAFGERLANDYELLVRLTRKLGAQHAWLTLGSSGSVVYTPEQAQEPHSCPAMVKTTVDTVGAGDAFYSVAALCGAVGADVRITSVLSNLAGAIAANVVGNEEPISKDAVVKNARYLFKTVGLAD
ncbi:MAG: PfkB family carbohydrate kinase [Dehalococcoidia bacterium]